MAEDNSQGGTSGSFTGESIGSPVIFTWVLDSLENDKQFKKLKSEFNPILGGDFTVTAGLKLTAPGHIESAYYAQGTDNSLFAKGSAYGIDGAGAGTGTAKIANLRHLQNLRSDHSKVGNGIKNAQQLCDIDCA